jgi:putative nucleotidyltransferase with HDIG domain
MPDRQRYHVPSGSYYVGRTQPLLLEAFLGTCVGVAMWDASAGVGGVLHLLLPEPVSGGSALQPQKFASTGFPLFLQELLRTGATKENLKAWIAGGALVGPVSDGDLSFDIGGRTAERVLQLMQLEGIAIDKAETGGFFTCCLSLDLLSWQCRIEPAGIERPGPQVDLHVPTAGEINRTIRHLKPVPQVALKILRIIDDELYDMRALTEEIRKDQVLSARTLRLCNSVVFASPKKIESLDQALVLLGRNLLIKFVISASLNELFYQSDCGYSLCKGGLYHHAVGTAVIAEKLAQIHGGVPPSLGYTAGLLHDIGKVVLDQYINSARPLFYRKLHEDGENFSAAEKAIFGADHSEVGDQLAQNWSFPESLMETIRCHHQPEQAQHQPLLVHIVYAADLLMARFHTGLELERLDTSALDSRLQVLGFSTLRFADLVDCIPVAVFRSTPEFALWETEA